MLENFDFEAKSFKADISPEEYIYLMFERTDFEDGVLYVPRILHSGFNNIEVNYKCIMNWTLEECEKVMCEYRTLYSHLRKIAAVYDFLGTDPKENKKLIKEDDVFNTWYVYIRDLDTSGFDMSLIMEIEEKYDTIRETREIAKRFSEETINEMEKKILKDYLDVSISEEEENLYSKYKAHIIKEAKKRVGDNVCAHALVIRARRVCRLLSLKAPAVVIDTEARQLASDLVIHKYAKEMEETEFVKGSMREIGDDYGLESDEIYKPKRKNKRKSSVSLYIFLVLKEYTNAEKHLSDQEFLDILKNKYDIVISRNTLARHVASLEDDGFSVYSVKGKGRWMEQTIK